jgi:PAS domain S-box-containing protein
MQELQTFYFINDKAVTAYCMNEIKKRSPGVSISVCSSFEKLFFKMAAKYSKESLVLTNFNFFEIPNLIQEYKINNDRSIINFIVNQNIDGVKISFINCRNVENYNYDYYEEQRAISKNWMLGLDIHINKTNICKRLMEKANNLQEFKKIYVDKRNLNLNEYVDEFASNVLKYFKAEYGCIVLLEERSGKKQLFKKVYNKHTIRNYEFGIESVELPTREKVEDIDSIENRCLREELKALKIKYHVMVPIQSVHAKGYLDFFSMLNCMGSPEHELIKTISKYITLLIDNTYFFQKTLKSKGSMINILDSIDDGVMIVDRNRTVLSLSEGMGKIIGWNEKEALGKSCKYLYRSCNILGESLCTSKDCPMFVPLHEMKSVIMQRVYALDKVGHRKIVKSTYLPARVSESGSTYYGVAIVRDLTERVQLEEQLQHFEQLASLGTIAATLAHEIRNPITGISSNAQFLFEESNISGTNRDIIKEIIGGANAIEETISRLVNLVHPIKPKLSKENINQIIKEVIKFLKNKMEYSNITLDISFAPGLPLIHLNKSLIKQVVMHIIMNAIESMENGGVLKVQTLLMDKTKMSDQETGHRVRVIVADTGIGIASDNLDKIFDPFFTTKNKGLGLGLYSIYRILKTHHASVEVQSMEGKGTTVIVNL